MQTSEEVETRPRKLPGKGGGVSQKVMDEDSSQKPAVKRRRMLPSETEDSPGNKSDLCDSTMIE